jgi:hypothetical protein
MARAAENLNRQRRVSPFRNGSPALTRSTKTLSPMAAQKEPEVPLLRRYLLFARNVGAATSTSISVSVSTKTASSMSGSSEPPTSAALIVTRGVVEKRRYSVSTPGASCRGSGEARGPGQRPRRAHRHEPMTDQPIAVVTISIVDHHVA